MEWNAKSPLQWDWENLIMFNAKSTEYPKKLRQSDWVIDGEGSIDFGSFYSSAGGGVGVGGGSGSDVGHASSKSSKSASINSSSIGEVKVSKFTLEAFEDVPEEFSKKKDYTKPHLTGSSPTFEASVGSGEPLLGLKLGKRTYFEDVCVGSNSKAPSSAVIPMSSDTPTKKSKTNCLSTHTQRCQVEGCNLDLSSAKSYHRKHRVCESHSKCPKVIVGGQERRFCQQCSRFHGLSEFDEKKRSCRRRLSDHNARRRKPQPEAVRLNQGRLSSSFNDMRQQMNLVFNRAPTVHAKAGATITWESTCESNFTQTKGYQFKSTKAGLDGQLHFASNELQAPITRICHDSNRFLPTKVITAEVLQGLEESGISSNFEETQDLHRALSLLSTNSWSLSEPKATSLDRTVHASHMSLPQSSTAVHSAARALEYWHSSAAQESIRSKVHPWTSPSDGSNHFQEFQLLKAPYDSEFYSAELN